MSVKYYKDGESIDISNIAIKGSGSTLPEYVQNGLFYYTDRDIGKIGSQAFIGEGLDFSNGYTFEVCAKITSTNNEYMRFLEFAPYGYDISSATVIASMNYGKIDMAINGEWYHNHSSYSWLVGELITISVVVDIPNRIAYVFVNGELADTFTNIPNNTSGMTDRGGYIYLGCGSVSDRVLEGNVYSGRYYNRILSATEMTVNRAVDAQRFT